MDIAPDKRGYPQNIFAISPLQSAQCGLLWSVDVCPPLCSVQRPTIYYKSLPTPPTRLGKLTGNLVGSIGVTCR